MNVKGFKNFLMQGNVVVAAIGLVVALALNTLIQAFATDFIDPLVNSIGGSGKHGLAVHLTGSQYISVGAFISAVIYFVVFMAVIYFVLVVPYRHVEARRGNTVFGTPAPVKACPACLSGDLPLAATRCKYCGADVPAAA